MVDQLPLVALVTSLEPSRAILVRSGQGAAAGDGLAICKALHFVALVALGQGDRRRHDPAIFPSATPIPRGRGILVAKRRAAGSGGGRNECQSARRLAPPPCMALLSSRSPASALMDTMSRSPARWAYFSKRETRVAASS